MANFITAAQVASYSGLDEGSITTQQLDSAEALVAAYLGTDTLEQTARTTAVYPGYDSTRFVLPYGPVDSIDEVTSLTIGTSSITIVDTVYLEGYWTLFYPTGEFSNGNKVVVVYNSGWDSSDITSLPTAIQKALLMTCAGLSSNPTRAYKSETIGDWSYTLGDDRASQIEASIPAPARVLLDRFVNPAYLI
jgi:hypothetical protein